MQELYNSDNRNKRDNNKNRDACKGSDATAREPEKKRQKAATAVQCLRNRKDASNCNDASKIRDFSNWGVLAENHTKM